MPAKKKGGLGTGLDALFRDDYLAEEAPTLLDISKLEPKDDQPRSVFEEEALETLAESIRQYGVLQPVTVRSIGEDSYQIIAGERRWRAAKMAGLTEMPVHLVEADDKKAAEIALVENLQREDLNPIEEAKGYRSLMEIYDLTQEDVSQSVGKSRPAVANSMRLLQLSPAVLSLVEKGDLSAGHARTLLAISDSERQLNAANEIIEKGYSVRKAEQLAAKLAKGPKVEVKKDPYAIDYGKEVAEELTKHLGRKVELNEGKKTGRIIIEYYDADDREKLIEQLKTIK